MTGIDTNNLSNSENFLDRVMLSPSNANSSVADLDDDDENKYKNDIEESQLEEYAPRDLIPPSVSSKESELNKPVIKTCRVVYIFKSSVNEVVCRVPPYPNVTSNDNSDSISKEEVILCSPLDRSIPKIRIKTRQWKKLQGQIVMLAIDNWPRTSLFPNGHILRVVGKTGDWKTDILAILLKHNISMAPFSTAALLCLPNVPNTTQNVDKNFGSGWCPDPKSVALRKDFRGIRNVFSVDPRGCQDIDDAMSVHWIKDGLVEVAIHIADVCAFVEKGSQLDIEAQARGTTVYLPHTRIDMLPSLLSSDIASLHCNQDRYAMSVVFHVQATNPNTNQHVTEKDNIFSLLNVENGIKFEILNNGMPVWYGRSVIHSIASMTYEQGHNIIFGFHPDCHLPPGFIIPTGQAGHPLKKEISDSLRNDLCFLTLFSRFLKSTRANRGSVDFTQTYSAQLKFDLDETASPEGVSQDEHTEIHDTISELMIVTNSVVARIIYEILPEKSLLREHSEVLVSKLYSVRDYAQSVGVNFVSDKNSDLKKDVMAYKQKLQNVDVRVVDMFTTMVIQSMNEARYTCSNGSQISDINTQTMLSDYSTNGEDDKSLQLTGHFGLGLKFYTHFTSPIRRYADIIVHRQLLVAIAVLNIQNKSHLSNLNSNNIRRNEIKAIVPESQTISIIDENELCNDTALSQTLKMVKTSDGRKMYEKVTSVSLQESKPVVISSLNHDTTFNKLDTKLESDFDELDDLLGDVVDDDLQSTSLNLKGASSYTSSSRQQYEDKVNRNSNDVDALDDLLGDVVDDDLQSTSLNLKGASSYTSSSRQQYKDKVNRNSNDVDALDDLLGDVVDDDLQSTSINLKTHESNKVNLLDEQVHEIKENMNTQISILKSMVYDRVQLESICNRLNVLNKNSKMVQRDCQNVFLKRYFSCKEEIHTAVIHSLKSNGFIVYIPTYSYRGPVHLTDKDGCVFMDPLLLPGCSSDNKSTPEIFHPPARISNYACKLIPSKQGDNALSDTSAREELLIYPTNSSNSNLATLRFSAMQLIRVAISSTEYIAKMSGKSISESSLDSNELVVRIVCDESNAQCYSNSNLSSCISFVLNNNEDNKVLSSDNRNEEKCSTRTDSPSLQLSIYCTTQLILNDNMEQFKSELKSYHNLLKKEFKMFEKEYVKSNLRESDADGQHTTSESASNKGSNITQLYSNYFPGHLENIQKNIHKYAIQGTGRMCFSTSSELDDVDILYKLYDSRTSHQEHNNAINKLAINSSYKGKQAAMDLMQKWGENWAEEEDLPTSWDSGVGQGADTETGLKAENGQMRKEVAIASQRMNKLKVAKRNSKYG
jgi:exoribonuclease R